jgi:O-antigen/teichoic acid export membrane protein
MSTVNDFSYFKLVRISFSGLFFAQGLNLLGVILMARLFVPSEFGLFSGWLSITSIATIVLSWRLELSLVMIQNDEVRHKSLKFILFSIAVSSAMLLLIVSTDFYSAILFPQFERVYAIASVVASGFVAVSQLWLAWMTSNGRYYELSFGRIAMAASILGVQVILGYFFKSAAALVFGYTVGALLGLCLLLYKKPIPLIYKGRLRLFFAEYFVFIKRKKNFIIYSLPADLVGLTAASVPVVMIVDKYGAAQAGVFALVVRILSAPLGVIGVAILDVFKRQSSSAFHNKGNCLDEYRYTFKILMGLAIFFAVMAIAFFDYFLKLLFADVWGDAGSVMMLLIPMFFVKYISSPLSYVFYIANKQSHDLIWQLLLLVFSISVIKYNDAFSDAMLVHGVGGAFMYVIYALMSYRLSFGYRGWC